VRFIVDVNLSPEWVTLLVRRGHDARHWRDIDADRAKDDEIIDWAAREQRIVFTADLDFAAAIAMRGLSVPSVVQLRTGSTDPNDVGSFVLDCIAAAESELFGGAILTIGAGRARLRRGPSNSQAADET
jgi:predicted nuclease of predicted toxin-antitoxin system